MTKAHRYVSFVIYLIYLFETCTSLGCRSESNGDVDWYLNYKLPKIEKEPVGSNLGSGKAYAYMTAPGSGSWKLSANSITGTSMLKYTLDNFYQIKEGLTYLFYNDDPPSSFNGTAVGHLKGILAFNVNTGFWLMHSMPKFASDKSYDYPSNALLYGQSILCVTFRTSELNEIAHQLLYSHPNIYSYAITDEVRDQLDDTAKTLFTDNPAFIRRKPLTRTTRLKSLANKQFLSFAKDNQFKFDLFSGVIAPGIQSSLVTETWRRGSGSFLPPTCQTNFTVLDIVSVNMTIRNRRNSKSIYFRSTEDHSKWAISDDDNNQNWICVADMNRMVSQERRGGGALCFMSKPIRSAYRSIIADTDQCPVK